MKRSGWVICLLLPVISAQSQAVQERLRVAALKLQADTQMKHAIVGISVVKTETGEKIFELNAQTGLAPASCQKIITSAAAMEILGPDYRYKTVLGYHGSIHDGSLTGGLVLTGSGDPSLGSWRYSATHEDVVKQHWANAVRKLGIKKFSGQLTGIALQWESATTPGGWIWDDIGNYYGAGIAALNWRENQYDLTLRSQGQQNSFVEIISAKPAPYEVVLESKAKAAAKGSGDNAYIYLAPAGKTGVVRGTIPAGEKAFTIAGSFPDPAMQTMVALRESLADFGAGNAPLDVYYGDGMISIEWPQLKDVDSFFSPTLDSLNYWFLKKSINLYGEAFLKTIAAEKTGYGTTEAGLTLIKKFWQERGIESAALHMLDGSGLSPQNRVTTDALVKVLQYANSRPWFHFYYDALPVFNQMKLKSGTIGGAKSFAGYHTAKDGTAYTVAIIINNYSGSAADLVKKMYLVLDELK